MSFVPLSLVSKQVSSPNRAMRHHDSLVFSITSQKYNSRKQTLLLDESKVINQQKNDTSYNDYFIIQDKIKSLEQKVENIKTTFCDEEKKQDAPAYKQNRPQIANLQFPEQIYTQKCFLKQEKSQIGKIKRKKQKSYFMAQQKSRTRSKSHSKNDDSNITTKRNDFSVHNVNDFSDYRHRNSFSRKKQTLNNTQLKRQRSTSFTMNKKSAVNENNHISQVKKLRKQLSENKLSVDRLSKKSKQSQRRLSICKDQTRKLNTQNYQLKKSLNQIQQKLKKSEKIRKKQKQMIQQQRQQIQQLKNFLEEVLKRNNDSSLRQSIHRNKQMKISKLKMLR